MGRDSGGRSSGGNEWTRYIVDEIKSSAPNALATGPFGSAISSRYFTEYGIPVIRGSNLSQDVGTRLNDDGLVFISERKAKEFSRSLAKPGDLVFTCWGTIDQVGLIDGRSLFQEYVISNKQMKLTPDTRKTDSLFLYYLFSSPSVRNEILNQGIGSSVPGFNLGQLRLMKLTLPPLPEQRAIAHILGTLDDKIELNRQMNETLEEMARALFKSWFIDFDPVHAKATLRQHAAAQITPPLGGSDWTVERARAYLDGMDPSIAALFPDRFVDSELGEIPEGWEVKALPEAIDINPTRSLRKGEVAPYLDMANMPTKGHTPDTVVDRPFGSGMRFINGDTLIARITPCLENGKTAYVDFLEKDTVGWGSTEYIVMRPNPPLPDEFSYCLARSAGFREFAVQSMTGSSGRQRVPVSALSNYLLPLPNGGKIPEVFGKIVKPLFLLASQNAEKSRTLAALRDTLLPKLISGELRVKDMKKALEQH